MYSLIIIIIINYLMLSCDIKNDVKFVIRIIYVYIILRPKIIKIKRRPDTYNGSWFIGPSRFRSWTGYSDVLLLLV